MRIKIPNGFEPREYQKLYMQYFDRGGKRAVWIVHRRGGKDLTALHQTAKMALERKGNYWHIFPTFKQARKAIWQGITADGRQILPWVFPSEIVKRKNEQDMSIELVNGSTWQLIGSDNIEVVGAGPVGVVFSEFALAKPSTWDLIRPMLRENGGWASFITTPRGDNHAKEIYETARKSPGWFHDLKTLYDTRAYDPEQTIAEERAEGMPDALIRQEYLCDWTAALVGSVWGDQIEAIDKDGRICDFDTATDGVFISADLGYSDATSLWAWRLNGQGGLDFVDFYESRTKPLLHYFEWLESRPWKYVMYWLPHDAAAHTLAAQTSVEDQFRTRYPGRVAIGPGLSLVDGIQAGRWLLGLKCRFHNRCAEGVKALRHYHYARDEDTKVWDKKPLHDWSSHAADGFRYAAVVAKHVMLSQLRENEPRKLPHGAEEIVVKDGKTTLGRPLEELFEEHQASRQKGRRI